MTAEQPAPSLVGRTAEAFLVANQPVPENAQPGLDLGELWRSTQSKRKWSEHPAARYTLAAGVRVAATVRPGAAAPGHKRMLAVTSGFAWIRKLGRALEEVSAIADSAGMSGASTARRVRGVAVSDSRVFIPTSASSMPRSRPYGLRCGKRREFLRGFSRDPVMCRDFLHPSPFNRERDIGNSVEPK